MPASPRVEVLMSVFDGARFLAPQLESIFAQTLPPRRVLVRDDGSRDDSRAILASFRDRGALEVVAGENLGPARSFFALLAQADPDADYFAFSDQDDVWLPEKLARAVARLAAEDPEVPLLYCSRLEFVDEDLRHLGWYRERVVPSFGNALVENIAAGCTIVLNRRARALLVRERPAQVLMHDWWFYLVVAAFGRVIYDEVAGIRHRLHGGNVVGAAPGFVGKVLRRARMARQPKPAYWLRDQAAMFLACYGAAADDETRALATRFARTSGSPVERARLALSGCLYRQHPLDTLALKSLILLDRH